MTTAPRHARSVIVRDAVALKRVARIEDVIATIFGRTLYRAGARPSEVRCCCWRPTHRDRHPSCRIDLVKQVFFCDVCGTGGDVVTVLQDWDPSATFNEILDWLDRQAAVLPRARVRPWMPAARPARTDRPRRTTEGPSPAAVYPYFDRHYRLRYRKVRTPDKQFYYQRLDRDGSWCAGQGGAAGVLYRLPALRQALRDAAENWTLVVEGEKDVETAWALGVPATTNPEGSGNGKWRPRYCRQLRWAGVRRVYVVPDRDVVGRLHAQQAVASCRDAGLRAVLVALPAAARDLTDYIELGHRRADVVALLSAADERPA
jgi:DNA primase